MSNAPRFDTALNDRNHAADCNCEGCMPEGADGAVDDALGAAQAEMAKSGVRGVFVLEPVRPRTRRVSFLGVGNSGRLDREAIRAAERHLTERGMRATALGSDLYLFAA